MNRIIIEVDNEPILVFENIPSEELSKIQLMIQQYQQAYSTNRE